MFLTGKNKSETYATKPPAVPAVPTPPLARNSAYGPTSNQLLTTTVSADVIWTAIENGGSSVHVPVTVVDTGGGAGVVRVLAMVGVTNTNVDGGPTSEPASFVVQVLSNDVAIFGAEAQATVVGNGYGTQIPIVVDVAQPSGLRNISIRVTFTGTGLSGDGTTGAEINLNQCSIDVQQLRPATG